MKIKQIMVLIILLGTIYSQHIFIEITGDSPLGQPPPSGDWIVSDSTAINDNNITLNGNLSITNNGILNLTNVTLIMNGNITVEGKFILRNVSVIMNCTENGSYGISIELGGLMYVFDFDNNPLTNDGSVITSSIMDGKHCYTYWVKTGSSFRMENSVLQECGYGILPEGGFYENYHGLFIETSEVQIKNSTIERSRNGVIFNNSISTNNLVYNCTFTNGTNASTHIYGLNGLCFTNSSTNIIEQCRFLNLKLGLDLTYSNFNKVINCYFEDNISQLSTDRETLGIILWKANNNTIIDNFEKMVYFGIMISDSNDNIIKNHTIESTRYGIQISSGCEYISLENIDITDINITGPSESAIGIMFWESNSHIVIINCSLNGYDAYGILWWGDQSGSTNYLLKSCIIDVTAVALSADQFGISTSDLIKDVVVENCYFKAEGVGFVSNYKMDRWHFNNCTFEKTTDWRYLDFMRGAVSIIDDAHNVTFQRCDFVYSGVGIDVVGCTINSYNNDMTFDIGFKNCNMANISFEGVSIWEPPNELSGRLLLENCTLKDNDRHGLLIRGDDIIVDIINCTIINNDEKGIYSVYNSDTEINIKNSTISSNGQDGLFIHTADSTTNIMIDNSSFNENNENGILTIYSNANINIQNSTLLSNLGDGLENTGGWTVVNNCEFSNNVDNGLLLESTSLYVSNSEISSNDGSGFDLSLCNGFINGNEIAKNRLPGIKSHKSIEKIIISNNIIKNNGYLNNQPQVSFINSIASIMNNSILTSDDGLYQSALTFERCPEINVEENIIEGNFSGYLIENKHSNIAIRNNQLLNCLSLAGGIYSSQTGKIQISNNTLDCPGKVGITIDYKSETTITNNKIFNWQTGVLINDSDVIIESNQMSQNGNGIILNNTGFSCKIINNSIIDSNNFGIGIKKSDDSIVINNNLMNNNIGIMVEGQIQIENNSIQGSSKYGIYVKPSGVASLNNNNIIDNKHGIMVEGGRIETNKNILTTNKNGISLINALVDSMMGDIIENGEIGLIAENSVFNLSEIKIHNNIDSMFILDSSCKIYNSSINGTIRNFILNDGSQCYLINVDLLNGSINILDTGSQLVQISYLNLTVEDINKQPILKMRVVIKNRKGLEIFNETTNNNAKFELLEIPTSVWTLTGKEELIPYEIILSKEGYGTTRNLVNIENNLEINVTGYKLSELITNVEVKDVPNDQGGAISLAWSNIPILNFGHYNIYVDTKRIDTLEFLRPINLVIHNQTNNSIIITEINGQPLINGETYYFAITITDSNGFEDWSIFVSSAFVIPNDDIIPPVIRNLTCTDTPYDDGGSITISWEASNIVDFEKYIIYCLTENSSDENNLLNLTPKLTIYDIEDTQQIISNLLDNNPYYFFVLVFDVNGNINLSYSIIGPIMPIDNLPPIINKNISYPLYTDLLEFNVDDNKNFRIYLDTMDIVNISWYLDNEFYTTSKEQSLSLDMSILSYGNHTLTIVVEESNGLSDSLTWNFSVLKPIDEPSDNGSNFIIVLWVVIVFIIIIILIVTIFSFKRFKRYQEANKTLRAIPDMNTKQISELIFKKREQGDRYILEKLIVGLPTILSSNSDKLFYILSSMAVDDNTKIKEDATQNLSMLIDKYPNKTFTWLRVLQEKGVKPDIYSLIAQKLKNEIVKNLVDKYHSNLIANNEDEYKLSLENSILAFKSSETIMNGLEMSVLYSTLNTFNRYRTVQSIITSRPIINQVIQQSKSESKLIYPEAIPIFEKLGLISETVGKYQKVESIEDKISYLFQATTLIENASKLSQESLLNPEKEFFNMVLNTWRNIISLSIRELRGRAELTFNLVGKEIIKTQDSVILKLEMKNIGRSIAERVLVELIPSNDYNVISKPQELGNIGQNKCKDLTIELTARTSEAFRVEFTVHYDDAERKGKTTSFGDLITFIQIGEEFIEIQNPYIIGIPIETGSELFIGRRDLIEFIGKNIRSSLQENIIVLVGHRRTGKTTLLKQLPIYLDKKFIPVYFDIQGIIDPGMDSFFHLLASEIVEAMQERDIDIEEPDFELFRERPSFYFEREFLKEVNSKLDDSILILLCDEFEELESKVDSGLLDKNIFSYLRHLMQHTKKLGFIFTGTSRLEYLKTDYWSILFNIALYKRVGFLSKDETKQLIIDPVKKYNMIYDSLAIDKIFRLTFGHPYFTQLLCHELVDLHNREKKNYITIQDVNGEIDRIIERGQMHFDFIWDSATTIDRLVMTSLIKVLNEEETAMVSGIVNKLNEYGLSMDSNTISKTLDSLVNKDIISKIMNHATTYEFKVDLIRIWLERTKHLDQVVEEYKANS